jgi:hypothetical protein
VAKDQRLKIIISVFNIIFMLHRQIPVVDFSFLHRIQARSPAHPASYPMGTGCTFPGGKVADT